MATIQDPQQYVEKRTQAAKWAGIAGGAILGIGLFVTGSWVVGLISGAVAAVHFGTVTIGGAAAGGTAGGTAAAGGTSGLALLLNNIGGVVTSVLQGATSVITNTLGGTSSFISSLFQFMMGHIPETIFALAGSAVGANYAMNRAEIGAQKELARFDAQDRAHLNNSLQQAYTRGKAGQDKGSAYQPTGKSMVSSIAEQEYSQEQYR